MLDREYTMALTRSLRGIRDPSPVPAPVTPTPVRSTGNGAAVSGGDPFAFLYAPEPSPFGTPRQQPAPPVQPAAPQPPSSVAAPPSPFDGQVAQRLGVEVSDWIGTPESVKAAVIRLLAALTQRAPGAAADEEPPAA